MSLKDKIPNIIHNTKNKITAAVILSSAWLSNSMAKAADVDTSFLTGEGNGTFTELQSTIEGTGASFYRLVMTIGVIGLVISLIFCGITLAVNKNASKREEGKSQLIWIALGGVVVFGSMSILGILKTVGGNL